jgi:hypothetical protein
MRVVALSKPRLSATRYTATVSVVATHNHAPNPPMRQPASSVVTAGAVLARRTRSVWTGVQRSAGRLRGGAQRTRGHVDPEAGEHVFALVEREAEPVVQPRRPRLGVGPSCAAAAPNASEVCSGWWAWTRRPHRRHRPIDTRDRVVTGVTGGSSVCHCSATRTISSSLPQQGHTFGNNASTVRSACRGGLTLDARQVIPSACPYPGHGIVTVTECARLDGSLRGELLGNCSDAGAECRRQHTLPLQPRGVRGHRGRGTGPHATVDDDDQVMGDHHRVSTVP